MLLWKIHQTLCLPIMNDFEIIKTHQLQPGDINLLAEDTLRIVLDVTYRDERLDYKITWLWENGTTTTSFYSNLTHVTCLVKPNDNNNHKTN